ELDQAAAAVGQQTCNSSTCGHKLALEKNLDAVLEVWISRVIVPQKGEDSKEILQVTVGAVDGHGAAVGGRTSKIVHLAELYPELAENITSALDNVRMTAELAERQRQH